MNHRDDASSEARSCDLRLHLLRRYEARELSSEESERIAAHIGECSRCAARDAELRAEREDFLRSTNIDAVSRQILSRLDRDPRAEAVARRYERSRFGWAIPALAIAGALVVVTLPLVRPGTLSKDPLTGSIRPATRSKGSPTIEMYALRSGAPERVADGAILAEGDRIQFEVRGMGRSYVFLVSIDARGVLAPLFPDEPTESLAVPPGGRHIMDGSVILDDAKGPEWFVGVFSSNPIRFEEIETALRRPASLGRESRPRPRDDSSSQIDQDLDRRPLAPTGPEFEWHGSDVDVAVVRVFKE